MITFKRFGFHGNLGNQLFQYASILGMSETYGHKVLMPTWKYSKYFQDPPEEWCNCFDCKHIKEPHFHYAASIPQLRDKNFAYDMEGWWQSEKYWEQSKLLVAQKLTFENNFIESVLKKSGEITTGNKTIAISIRRGDYVDNPNYYQLPIEYYITALMENFEDWRSHEILIFSDDLDYCRVHFSCMTNVHFADELGCKKDIEQLALMSLCDHFIISNSTFSWWGAYLGEKEHSKIIHPAYHFAGKLLQTSNAKDYYPERWINFDHVGKRIDLSDVTFTVPVSYDHLDRKQNLDLNICLLQRTFNTKIIIGEQGEAPRFEYMRQWCLYRHFKSLRNFHRTFMLNQMAIMAGTPIIVNWDADVIVPPMQIFMAVELIREGTAQMVYPYDGRFARVPRNVWFKKMEKYLDIAIVGNLQFKGMQPSDRKSVGGAVFFNKAAFISGGMENEKMITYAPEDIERFHRFNALGFLIAMIKGPLYHMDHYRGHNSLTSNSYYAKNVDEYRKVKAMDKQQIIDYIADWPWLKSELLNSLATLDSPVK